MVALLDCWYYVSREDAEFVGCFARLVAPQKDGFLSCHGQRPRTFVVEESWGFRERFFYYYHKYRHY